jgi:uncharacterized repeat protein (TIGR03809 family)
MIPLIPRRLVTHPMQARSNALSSDQIARRWRDLAERRRSHFVELYQSGRWKLYYSEADFAARMQEVVQAAERWEKLASAQLSKVAS